MASINQINPIPRSSSLRGRRSNFHQDIEERLTEKLSCSPDSRASVEWIVPEPQRWTSTRARRASQLQQMVRRLSLRELFFDTCFPSAVVATKTSRKSVHSISGSQNLSVSFAIDHRLPSPPNDKAQLPALKGAVLSASISLRRRKRQSGRWARGSTAAPC